MSRTKADGGAKARYGELAAERYRLEERAEAEVLALRKTMDEIRDLDARQRREAHAGGEVADFTPAGTILSGWLANRLGGPGGTRGWCLASTTRRRWWK